MTRKEEIKQASIKYQMSIIPVVVGGAAFADEVEIFNINSSFVAGAKWADDYWQERFSSINLTSRGRLYSIWLGMKSRCNNKNNVSYYRYGDRGIKVCDEWNSYFINFAIWSIFNGYNDELTIDRIDIDKGYNPDNCRWVDILTQMNNTSRNHFINDDTIGELARKYNINYRTLHNRLTRGGMSVEEAISCKKAYRYRTVCQYDLNGNFIAEYPSARVAVKEIFGEYSESIRKRIVAVCYGKAKQTRGFIFKYKD